VDVDLVLKRVRIPAPNHALHQANILARRRADQPGQVVQLAHVLTTTTRDRRCSRVVAVIGLAADSGTVRVCRTCLSRVPSRSVTLTGSYGCNAGFGIAVNVS